MKLVRLSTVGPTVVVVVDVARIVVVAAPIGDVVPRTIGEDAEEDTASEHRIQCLTGSFPRPGAVSRAGPGRDVSDDVRARVAIFHGACHGSYCRARWGEYGAVWKSILLGCAPLTEYGGEFQLRGSAENVHGPAARLRRIRTTKHRFPGGADTPIPWIRVCAIRPVVRIFAEKPRKPAKFGGAFDVVQAYHTQEPREIAW